MPCCYGLLASLRTEQSDATNGAPGLTTNGARASLRTEPNDSCESASSRKLLPSTAFRVAGEASLKNRERASCVQSVASVARSGATPLSKYSIGAYLIKEAGPHA